MANTKPRRFARLFLTFLVHDNRVEIRDGLWPFRRTQIIPFRNIANVGVSKFTNRLEIVTNDGKRQKYALGGFGKAQRCRDAIAERLA